MADKPFSSIIDAFLADREPEWKNLGLTDAKKSGDEQKDRTRQYVDKEFTDEIAESASRHTPIPPSKSATLQNRLREKERAAPLITAVRANWHKDAYPREDEYRNTYGDNDSLFNEVTMSLEKAHSEGNLKENSADKKEVSDAAVQSYLRGLLNQGTAPAKVAQQLEKLAELELFNHTTATDYLQRNAGMLGLAYLEPNTFMNKQDPSYRHNAGKTAAAPYGPTNPPPVDAENPPDDWVDCGSCGGTHPPDFWGDCRDDYNRWPSAYTTGEKAIDPSATGPDLSLHHMTKPMMSSNECVASFEGMKRAGITPRAKSVKQIKACTDCSFFKKDASGKRCNLYHLPVVANVEELSQIVNNLTPGVPQKQKHAALVQIANRTDEHVQMFDAGKTAQTQIVKTADARVNNQANRQPLKRYTFTSEHLAKLHNKGVSFKDAYKWADRKFGSVETSVAFRGFVQSLRKNGKGKIVVAAADLQFLNSIGIRSETFEGGAKCASCPNHFGREARPIESGYGTMRVDGKFAQRTASVAAIQQKEAAEITITAAEIRKVHQKGHSLEKIYKAVAAKIGTPEAKRIVAQYLASLKKVPGRIQVTASDRSFLERVGFKAEALRTLEQVRPPVDRVVASSGDAPILGYPGMNDPNKKTASKKAEDGRTILDEYDLSSPVPGPDIDMKEPERLDVQTKDSFKVDVD
jgi:hypothetical protein